jgi:drug/metabolite transporter (DMT)-like permease
VLTVPDVFTDPGRIDAAGVALALAQAVLFAVYLVANERVVPERVNGLVSAAWSLPGAALFIVPFVVVDGLQAPPDAEATRMLALFVLVPTVLAITTFFLALRDLDPTLLAMILTMEIALAIAWSVIFLGEDVGPPQVVGALLVAAGVLWSERADRMKVDTGAAIPLP